MVLRDRLTANDPDTVPATCNTIGPALAVAGKGAARADFTASLRRTTWLTAGLIALTFLLGYLLPRTARPDQPVELSTE